MKLKMIAIVGSLRKGSLNMALAKSMQERYRDKFDLEIADIGTLPYYNTDDEEHPNDTVLGLKKQINEADAVFILTPEYNWSIPGVLKNALDWLSRGDKVLVDKPVLIAGVTPAMLGTVRAQLHLREILSSLGISARMLPPGGNEILINMANDKFDASGRLTDQNTLTFLDQVVDKFLQMI